MTGPGTLWRTVRHLKARQLWGRMVFRLVRPRADLRPPPPHRGRDETARGRWVAPARRVPSLVAPERWRLLAIEGELDDLGWDGPAVEKLWRYNQHYFDDLNAFGAVERRAWHLALLKRWVDDNPPGHGSGWEPYPVSLRIVNWIKAFLGGLEPDEALAHSLAVQARWLNRRVEWHLLGNHLFANAKALVFAGLWFHGPEAVAWLRKGSTILVRQLPEQVLADGGQFERSPMYHALALEDVLDLMNVARALGGNVPEAGTLLEACAQRAPAMLHWLRCMSHPDGGIAFFNDAAHGIAPDNAELERYAAALGVHAAEPAPQAVRLLWPSGYVRAHRGPALALIDLAPVGPDYLPGHAYADTLSFELSLGSRRVVVNGGTSCYGLSETRSKERGTAAHSTVQIGAHDSSETWSGFRVGRRARPFAVTVGDDMVSGSHDGYAWLPGRPVHKRTWRFGDSGLSVEDEIEGSPGEEAVARFHLAPGITLVESGEGHWRVMAESTCIAEVTATEGRAEVLPSRYAPAFGVVLPTWMLAVHFSGRCATTRWTWSPCAYPVPQRQLSA